MEERKTDHACVALLTEKAPDRQEAIRLVRQALQRRGETPWKAMEIELFPGETGCLVIARPTAEPRVYICGWALGYLLGKYGV